MCTCALLYFSTPSRAVLCRAVPIFAAVWQRGMFGRFTHRIILSTCSAAGVGDEGGELGLPVKLACHAADVIAVSAAHR